jgi:hypothetical protein
MSSIIKRIAEFFGFGSTPKSAREEFEEMLRLISSQKRLDECSKMAFRAIQKGGTQPQGQAHPYEGTIKAECIKADAALSAYRVEDLTKTFGDATYLIAQIHGGAGAQLADFTPQAVETQIAGAISQNTPAADRLKEKLADKERELHIFKGANGLQRTAEQPAKLNIIYYALTFAILEALANFWFLKQSLFSPAVALLISLALAGLNVGGNVWLGNRYREKNHIDPDIASKGKRNFMYAVALIFGIGLIIAWARFESQGAQNAMSSNFIIESIVLMAIGVALGILAFTKGYGMDDPYPGFGPLSRSVEALREELSAMTESHASFCEKLLQAATGAHSSAKARIRSSATTLATALPEIARALKEWTHQREQIQAAYAQQQQVFKAIMAANARDGAAYPQAIEQLPTSPQLESRKEEVESLTKRTDTFNGNIDALIAEIDESLGRLQEWTGSETARNLLRWPE